MAALVGAILAIVDTTVTHFTHNDIMALIITIIIAYLLISIIAKIDEYLFREGH